MQVKPYARNFSVILVIMVIFLSGCLSRSPEPRFYALSPVQDQVIARRSGTGQNAVIGLGPVKLADYLDQSQLITRTSDNQLVKAEYDLWVGAFKDNFINVLADNLGFFLRTEKIHLYPWRKSVPLDYHVEVDVVQCDGRLGEAAWLVAR